MYLELWQVHLFHPDRALESVVRQLGGQIVTLAGHVSDELLNPHFGKTLRVDYIVVIGLQQLAAMIRDKNKVVVNAPGKNQIDEKERNERVLFFPLELHGPRKTTGDT